MKRLIALTLLAVLVLSGCATEPETSLPAVSYPVSQPQLVTLNEEGLTDEEILAQRRDTVEAQMRQMMGLLWTPAEDMTYSFSETPMELKAGRIYRGMPYSHCSGSGFSFMTYATSQDENGVYTITMDSKMIDGTNGKTGCLSNDCADALFWAWGTVSSSIDFRYTQRMSKYTGCVQVGDYYWPDNVIFNGSTKPIVKENGEEVMMRCYAQLQKGDGLVLFTDTSGGHAVMIAETTVVMNGDKIDPELSTVRILEQESSGLKNELTYEDENIGTVYIACGYDEIWTFATLYKKGYLPITCKELVDPSPLAEQVVSDSVTEPDESNMFTGLLESNYRLSSVTYTVYDKKGTAVQQSTCFVRETSMYTFEMYLFEDFFEQDYLQGTLDLDSLPSGTYNIVLTCQISTGSILELRNFTIER